MPTALSVKQNEQKNPPGRSLGSSEFSARSPAYHQNSEQDQRKTVVRKFDAALNPPIRSAILTQRSGNAETGSRNAKRFCSRKWRITMRRTAVVPRTAAPDHRRRFRLASPTLPQSSATWLCQVRLKEAQRGRDNTAHGCGNHERGAKALDQRRKCMRQLVLVGLADRAVTVFRVDVFYPL
jgi:hypothetical protein